MLETNLNQVIDTLGAVGLQQGDGVIVHSALHFLGRPTGGLETYLNAFHEVLGAQGTLAVPTFTFGFARGEPFDRQNTPSSGMGVFSEYIRLHPEARRTTHPLQSIAVIGRHRDDLTERDTLCAFDDGSAFDRMLELGFKLVLLGAGIQAASMVHYCEQRLPVPYRYWKDFTGSWRDGAVEEQRTYRMFARDLQINPQLALTPIEFALKETKGWREAALGYGKVCACTLADFVKQTNRLLHADAWALVGNGPAEPVGGAN